MRSVKRLAKTALSMATIALLWFIASKAYNSPLFPGPIEVLYSFIILSIRIDTWFNVATTLNRVLMGVLLGSLVGLLMGLSPRYSLKISRFIELTIQPVLESVPALCWALIFAVLFGLSGVAPILVVAASITPFFTINLWEGVKDMDENLIEMSWAFTRKKLRVFRHVILPMLYPYLFAAFRSSFEVAWKVVILGEVFGAVDGLGYMLWLSFSSYDITRMFAWVVYCALFIALFDYLIFDLVDKHFMRRWRYG